jgi:hypothetical protein
VLNWRFTQTQQIHKRPGTSWRLNSGLCTSTNIGHLLDSTIALGDEALYVGFDLALHVPVTGTVRAPKADALRE